MSDTLLSMIVGITQFWKITKRVKKYFLTHIFKNIFSCETSQSLLYFNLIGKRVINLTGEAQELRRCVRVKNHEPDPFQVLINNFEIFHKRNAETLCFKT